MNTDTHSTNIIIPDNQPVNMRRTPQLGDVLVVHGGERPAGPDAPSLDAAISKGDLREETASEGKALGGILGGSSTATSDSEKNFADTPPAVADGAIGDTPTGDIPPMVVHERTSAELCWTDGERMGWLIRNEVDGQDECFASYEAANAYFEANERTRWLVPGADEVPGWKAAPSSGADAPRDTKEDVLATGDGSNAVGDGPRV
jgi:hypothetical protein